MMKGKAEEPSLSDFDIYLIALILSFLDPESRLSASFVCKTWNKVIKSKASQEIYIPIVTCNYGHSSEDFTQEQLIKVIINREFSWCMGFMADTKEAVYDYMKLDFAKLFDSMETKIFLEFFVAYCQLDGNKLTFLSCEHVNLQPSITYEFLPPIICDKRAIGITGRSRMDFGDMDKLIAKDEEYSRWNKKFEEIAKMKAQSKNNPEHQSLDFATQNTQTSEVPPSKCKATLFKKPVKELKSLLHNNISKRCLIS